MKKAIALLVCLVLCIIGHAQTTISVSTEGQFRAIADSVNRGLRTYENTRIELANDIVLTSAWTPMGYISGNTARPFKGVFDGQNHTISNLHITNGGDYSALFGLLEGVVENVIVKGVIVSASNSGHISGIVGLAWRKGTLVRNCHFIGSITATTSEAKDLFVGGVVGELKDGAVVSGCSATGKIRGDWTGGGQAKCIGGIVGRCGPKDSSPTDNVCIIENCINLADVRGYSSVGGIIAFARQHAVIRNCFNCGNIEGNEATKNYFGGIVGGYYKDIEMRNCLSTGTTFSTRPSAAIGKVSTNEFSDVCPKINIYYDYQRMRENYSRHGDSVYTDMCINGNLLPDVDGWMQTDGYPIPCGFINNSVIMVAKSYALFFNSETYDDIHTNFTVSDFAGTAWSSTGRGLTEINGRNVNILADGRDTLTVGCGSYYKNVIVDVNVPTPLPITLLHFTATETDCGNLLEWATATESHNAGFSLMRSSDAINWEVFAWQPTLCNGNSTATTNYSYMDADIRWDTTYYKFVQYDSIWTQFETYYPESSEIIVAMRRDGKPELPSIMYDGGCIVLVAGSTTTDAYAYDTIGRLIYDARLKPRTTARLVVKGNAIIEFLWVENGELMRKAYKVGFAY